MTGPEAAVPGGERSLNAANTPLATLIAAVNSSSSPVIRDRQLLLNVIPSSQFHRVPCHQSYRVKILIYQFII